jgi:hypothetical protein
VEPTGKRWRLISQGFQAGNQVFLNDLMRQQQRGVEVQKANEAAAPNPAPMRKEGK